MSEWSRRHKSSRGLFSNSRFLCKRSLMLRTLQSARTRKNQQQQRTEISTMKRKPSDGHVEPLDTFKQVKKTKPNKLKQEREPAVTSDPRSSGPDPGPSEAALGDRWEVDSGFCSETSPPASGRSSPCLGPAPATTSTSVVALDCEMVGTGPGGRCSELARCSILDYHGNVLYDEYVRPCQPVTDYRTRWSGIRSHHLLNATPFSQARHQILRILEGKVVVGHSVYNDFQVLDLVHPGHMVRDTCTTRHLSRLAGFPRQRCSSLKTLSSKLLNRKIQAGRGGHCSVEDALAALDLYKLVEGEWERELQDKLQDEDAPSEPSFASSTHYMQDEYWPDDVTALSQ
ncbi:apoptosis-enhancing nuclease [Centropristis striata]|nr:apoptosis-enhancing nuclease [Centropristis striata]